MKHFFPNSSINFIPGKSYQSDPQYVAADQRKLEIEAVKLYDACDEIGMGDIQEMKQKFIFFKSKISQK